MVAEQNLPDRIRDYYEDPYHRGRCDAPTHSAEQGNAECGDVVAVELRVVSGQVQEIWFDGEGCQVSQAATSILAEHFEDFATEAVLECTDAQAISIVGTDQPTDCVLLGLRAFKQALRQPPEVDEDDDYPTFSGPDLGDEC